MKQTYTLAATSRTATRKAVRRLRRDGSIPAVLYGHGRKSVALEIPLREFQQVYRQAGESSIIDLSVDGASSSHVLIQDVQRHPASGVLLHVDLYAVRMDEKVTAETEIRLTGESPAVKELGGVLVQNLSMLRVECLPADLPAEIVVDIAGLAQFGEHVTVAHLAIPQQVTVLEKPETVVVSVSAPRSEEELAALDEKPVEDVSAVEVEEKGKKDEEGEAAAAGTAGTAPAEKPEKPTKPEKSAKPAKKE